MLELTIQIQLVWCQEDFFNVSEMHSSSKGPDEPLVKRKYHQLTKHLQK